MSNVVSASVKWENVIESKASKIIKVTKNKKILFMCIYGVYVAGGRFSDH